MLKLLPKDTQLIPSNIDGSLIQRVDLDNDGRFEYTALYNYPYDGLRFVGAILVANDQGIIKKFWQYNGKISLVSPASLSIKDIQNDGKKEIIFKAQVGAMANYYDILALENGGVKSVFHTFAYRMDIGHYGRTKSSQGKQGSAPKGIAYGLAQAYFGAGEYQAALFEVNTGLNRNANDYPPNSDFVMLKNQIMKAITAIPKKHVINTEESNNVQFPSLIKNAMKRFPPNGLSMAKVPTQISF